MFKACSCIILLTKTSYLDRINVSNARLAGLQEDLHMTDTIWNTGIVCSSRRHKLTPTHDDFENIR